MASEKGAKTLITLGFAMGSALIKRFLGGATKPPTSVIHPVSISTEPKKPIKAPGPESLPKTSVVDKQKAPSYQLMNNMFGLNAPNQMHSGRPMRSLSVINARGPQLATQTRPITQDTKDKLQRRYAQKSTPKEQSELEQLYADHNSTLPMNTPSVTVPTVIRELNLEGGGGRGPAYIGPLLALYKRGELKNLQHVSGTSVGAITAALMGFGATPKQLDAMARHPNSFLNDMPLYNKALEEFFKQSQQREDALDLASSSDEGITLMMLAAVSTISAAAEQGAWSAGENLKKFLEDQMEKLIKDAAKAFPAIYDEFVDPRNPTFKELETARKKFPMAGLLDVSVTLTRKADGKAVLANAKTMPDVSITQAALASAAIPYVFKPVKIQGQLHIDGGVRQNIGATSGQFPPEQCLVLGFDKPPLVPSVRSSLMGLASYQMLGTNIDLSNAATRIAAENNVPGYLIKVPYKPLSTFNMNPTAEQLDTAIERGYNAAMKQLDQLQEKREEFAKNATSQNTVTVGLKK